MNDISAVTYFLICSGVATAIVTLIGVTLFLKQQLSGSRFTRFLCIFGILFAASWIPLYVIGAFFGFPSVLIGSLLVSIFLDKVEVK